jgi:hypothetical protein
MNFLDLMTSNYVTILTILATNFVCFRLFLQVKKLVQSGYKLVKFAMDLYDYYKPQLMDYATSANQKKNFKELLILTDDFTEQIAKVANKLSVDKKTVKKLQDIIKKSDYKSL